MNRKCFDSTQPMTAMQPRDDERGTPTLLPEVAVSNPTDNEGEDLDRSADTGREPVRFRISTANQQLAPPPRPKHNSMEQTSRPIAARLMSHSSNHDYQRAGFSGVVNSRHISAEIVTCNRLDKMSAIVSTPESVAVAALVVARFVDKDGRALHHPQPPQPRSRQPR